ncbi:hypothetical protein V5799_021030 [Amblyomma americanum]|uniref:Peptidase S1 domain-containing protein n=1 Tax=Amblyomma americanum TaxID=6943 RepID=A0AAQ4FPL3_AMBAM
MRVLLLSVGLLALGSNLRCDAHLLGKVTSATAFCCGVLTGGEDFDRGRAKRAVASCVLPGSGARPVPGQESVRPRLPGRDVHAVGQSRDLFLLHAGDFVSPVNPFNVLDDIFKSIPGLGSELGGPHVGTRPYVPTIPHLPQDGSFGMPVNPQGPAPLPQPFPPLDGGSGAPVEPEYPPAAVNPRPPRGNSPGTGPVPPRPGNAGPAIPPVPDSKPGKQPAGGSSPPAAAAAPPAADCETSQQQPGRCVPEASCPPERRERSSSCAGHVCCRRESRPQRSADKERMLAALRENRQLCGRNPPSKDGRDKQRFPVHYVLGGRSVRKHGDYPFVVAVFRDKIKVDNFWCGGALITKQVVLSAAHCFYNAAEAPLQTHQPRERILSESVAQAAANGRKLGNDTEFLVRMGSLDISKSRVRGAMSNTVERKVRTVHLHPAYNGRQQNADLALLLLHKDVSEGQTPAACLPDQEATLDAHRGVILGWGHNGFGGKLQTNLQEADVPLVSNEECDKLYMKLGTYKTVFHHGVDQDFLCAGNITEGGVDACQVPYEELKPESL